MTSKELSDELECIVKYLCKVANKQDKYALEIVDKVKKDLEVLDLLQEVFQAKSIKGDKLIEIKKWNILDDVNQTFIQCNDGRFNITERQYKLLKEVFEDDK